MFQPCFYMVPEQKGSPVLAKLAFFGIFIWAFYLSLSPGATNRQAACLYASRLQAAVFQVWTHLEAWYVTCDGLQPVAGRLCVAVQLVPLCQQLLVVCLTQCHLKVLRLYCLWQQRCTQRVAQEQYWYHIACFILSCKHLHIKSALAYSLLDLYLLGPQAHYICSQKICIDLDYNLGKLNFLKNGCSLSATNDLNFISQKIREISFLAKKPNIRTTVEYLPTARV